MSEIRLVSVDKGLRSVMELLWRESEIRLVSFDKGLRSVMELLWR